MSSISPHARIYGNVKMGENVRIDDGCILTGDIEIGNHVHIGPYSVLSGKSGIKIGNYSGFSAFATVHSESDDYSGRSMFLPNIPDQYKPFKKRGEIVIGDGVILGVRVSVLPGVTIHDGVSVGAFSLVKDDCEANTIYAGIPARPVGKRLEEFWRLVGEFETSR